MAKNKTTAITKAEEPQKQEQNQASACVHDAPLQSAEKDIMTEKEAKALLSGKNRIHTEALGTAWAVVLGENPAKIIPNVIAHVLSQGGTRPSWKWQEQQEEHMIMAWPSDQPVRAAVHLRATEKEGELTPMDAFPLLEGLPNDLTVSEVHPWQSGGGANVAVSMIEGKNPMWFYNPFYLRDKTDLTPDVTHTFTIAGLAFGLRKALLDDITLTQGPEFETHAAQWLKENPGKTRLDVPPYKVSVRGKHMIMPGRAFGEYQMRATVEDVQEVKLNQMDITLIRVSFPFDNRPSLILPIYASKLVLGDYTPAVGDDIDGYIWLQARVIDFDPAEDAKPA